MGTLKYAILGLLNRRSMTGYDMTKEFETTLFEFWSAKHSQIYPELKYLTEAGLIEYKIEIAGSVLEKKLYSITEAGRKDFQQWELLQHKIKPTHKDEFRLQLFFSDSIAPERRLSLLQSQLQEHQERLEHLRNNLQKFSVLPPVQQTEFSDYLVLLGAIMREESCCSWLETCIRLCLERKDM